MFSESVPIKHIAPKLSDQHIAPDGRLICSFTCDHQHCSFNRQSNDIITQVHMFSRWWWMYTWFLQTVLEVSTILWHLFMFFSFLLKSLFHCDEMQYHMRLYVLYDWLDTMLLQKPFMNYCHCVETFFIKLNHENYHLRLEIFGNWFGIIILQV